MPAGFAYVGRWTEAGATNQTCVLSGRPDGCGKPTPAVTPARGVGDAAPYGRQRDKGISIVVNMCVKR